MLKLINPHIFKNIEQAVARMDQMFKLFRLHLIRYGLGNPDIPVFLLPEPLYLILSVRYICHSAVFLKITSAKITLFLCHIKHP